MKLSLILLSLAVAIGALAQLSRPDVLARLNRPAAAGGGGSYSVVFTNVTAGNTTGTTTTSGDTTGCTLLIVAVNYYSALGATPLSDSKGNTWTARTTYTTTNNYKTKIYYVENPTVGASHTFSTTADYSVLGVIGVSGNAATPYDTENGFAVASSTTIQPGSITPSQNNCLVVCAATSSSSDATYTINESFIKIDSKKNTSGALIGGIAYIIQTTASAVNPTWTAASSVVQSATIDSFK